MPLSGEILAINQDLDERPQLVNEDPFGAGWFVRFRPSQPEEFESLLGAASYEKRCQEAEQGG
jgi:glycine cleavage system H protein